MCKIGQDGHGSSSKEIRKTSLVLNDNGFCDGTTSDNKRVASCCLFHSLPQDASFIDVKEKNGRTA